MTSIKTAPDTLLGWIEMAGHRHGLSAGDAGPNELAELEQFILAAGRAREAAGISPNTSMSLAGIWRDRDRPDWAGKHGLGPYAWPILDAGPRRAYLEALETWFNHIKAGPDEYTLAVSGHHWSRPTASRNTEQCPACGLTLTLAWEPAGRGMWDQPTAASISPGQQAHGGLFPEHPGECLGQDPDGETRYFLKAPHGAGMRRVDRDEWRRVTGQ